MSSCTAISGCTLAQMLCAYLLLQEVELLRGPNDFQGVLSPCSGCCCCHWVTSSGRPSLLPAESQRIHFGEGFVDSMMGRTVGEGARQRRGSRGGGGRKEPA